MGFMGKKALTAAIILIVIAGIGLAFAIVAIIMAARISWKGRQSGR